MNLKTCSHGYYDPLEVVQLINKLGGLIRQETLKEAAKVMEDAAEDTCSCLRADDYRYFAQKIRTLPVKKLDNITIEVKELEDPNDDHDHLWGYYEGDHYEHCRICGKRGERTP